ncbi:hypothetical protein IEQ34_007240 [Dendrobium chrysotoxum]|uniref:Uncharacterized protein n=1 Tax=Dendrobium chrysotoxum TaxID=161865 RepID=A0AAV7H8L5_DENCH|nr:hypothetical protein IEQ34_007240 [Dendrobium chrysotoxum]
MKGLTTNLQHGPGGRIVAFFLVSWTAIFAIEWPEGTLGTGSQTSHIPKMKLDTSGLETFVPPSRGLDVLPSDFTASPALTDSLWFALQFDGFQKNAVQMVKPAKGTTTLAFIFKEGVIVAADSRASMGGYIYSRGGISVKLMVVLFLLCIWEAFVLIVMGALGGFLGFVAWAFVISFAA